MEPVTVYREDINPMKREFATTRRITTLAEALHDADVFLGVSKADTLTPEMLRTMSGNPIVMALANPDPEIAYDTAMLSRPDIIFATAVRTTRTRSTTCWASPTSSGVRSTCGPRRSTRR